MTGSIEALLLYIEPLLEITDLHVEIADKEVLKGVSLSIYPGETHILFGPNGSGKSTLIKTIMGLSECKVTKGSIRFLGNDVTHATISERSIMGMGMLFQNPPEIEGLPLKHLIENAFKDNTPSYIRETSKSTSMTDYLERDLNVGFSGGERKRCEALQLLLQKPILSMLDEPESGVDLQSVHVLGKVLSSLQNNVINGIPSATIIITHTGSILEYMHGTCAHILINGELRCSGDEQALFSIIQRDGFDYFLNNCCDRKCDHCEKKQHIDAVQKEIDQPSLLDQFMSPAKSSFFDAIDAIQDQQFIDDYTLPAVLDDSNRLLVQSVDEEVYGGLYQQRDQDIETFESYEEGIEVISLKKALEKYPWIREKYMWKALAKDKDAITRAVAANDETNPTGYVIIAHEGCKSVNPINSQLIMENNQFQYVHNILISMPGSSLTVASSCLYHCANKNGHEEVLGGEHYGISEFYVEKDSQLCFSMIHTWCNSYVVYPRSAAIVEENGVFYSNYVCLEPVNKVQMCPVADLRGKNAVAKFSSVLLAKENTVLDVGSVAKLNAEGARSESITRTISKGGVIYARADIQGNAPNTKGHIECQGLVIEEGQGMIYSIPQISGGFGTELSHEAAIGKIAKEKIEYLMTRRLTEDEAVSIIIRGFLNIRVQGIPRVIQDQMDAVIEQASKEGF